MKKLVLWAFVSTFIFLGFANNLQIQAEAPLIMLDEFVPYPSANGEEWVELLNPNQDSALDLTGWRLVIYQGVEPNYTYYYTQDLSGSVPRSGFLTFATDNDARIPNDGACLVIFRDNTNSVYAVKYGNGTCDSGAGEQDATGVTIEQGKSIYYNLDAQTWNSGSSPTRGWCNPGSGECPTISTITNQMASENVATNLGDQADFSRISGLYFQKSESGQNVGRITFLSEMNFTDRDALAWMQSLDSKLSISQGIISLDADLIKNLTNTNASLTMYNLTLNNPKILVNGQDDNSGIVSGLSYDQTAHSLSFTAAHFTTFTAVENTSSSTSTGISNDPPSCGSWPPLGTPNLFQIDTSKNSATLYFMPVTDYLSYYFIAYGYKEGDWRFGTQFDSTQKNGVIKYTINELKPNMTYYFQVRGGNGCKPGKWSNSLAAKTKNISVAVKKSSTEEVLGADTTSEVTELKIVDPTPTAVLTLEPTKIIQPQEAVPISKSPEKTSYFWQRIANFFKNLF